MKYLEEINEVDICWRHQALLSRDHPPSENLWDTHQEWLCSNPTLCNTLSLFISGDGSIIQLLLQTFPPCTSQAEKIFQQKILFPLKN